jgi:RNA polymerase sigma-70 factor (ECF subfamily)
MGQLSEADAEVLLLKYTESWSYRQLADHLGISLSAVQARLHRARARLRSALEALDVVGTET